MAQWSGVHVAFAKDFSSTVSMLVGSQPPVIPGLGKSSALFWPLWATALTTHTSRKYIMQNYKEIFENQKNGLSIMISIFQMI